MSFPALPRSSNAAGVCSAIWRVRVDDAALEVSATGVLDTGWSRNWADAIRRPFEQMNPQMPAWSRYAAVSVHGYSPARSLETLFAPRVSSSGRGGGGPDEVSRVGPASPSLRALLCTACTGQKNPGPPMMSRTAVGPRRIWSGGSSPGRAWRAKHAGDGGTEVRRGSGSASGSVSCSGS